MMVDPDAPQKSAVTGARPATGWMAVVPIPGSTEGAEPDQMFGPFVLMGTGSSGITAGIVLEIAEPVPGGKAEEFGIGDTVYFPADRGIEIGDRVFITQATPIAYNPVEEM